MRPFPPAPKDLVRRWTRLGLGAARRPRRGGVAARDREREPQPARDHPGRQRPEQSRRSVPGVPALGANTVRVVVPWSRSLPARAPPRSPTSTPPIPTPIQRPWAPFDNIVRAAASRRHDRRLHGDGRRAALGREARLAEGRRRQPLFFAWKPNAADYGQFVQAVGTRYSGHFTPKGADLGAARGPLLGDLFNEPNFGQDLGPQAINDSKVAAPRRCVPQPGQRRAGRRCRPPVTAQHDPHRRASRPRASSPAVPKKTGGLPGNYGQTRPLQFLR